MKLIFRALGVTHLSLTDKEQVKVDIIRLIILLQSITTNIFIISGIIKHWND